MRTYGTLMWRDPSFHPDMTRPMWAVKAEPHVMVRLRRIFPRASTSHGIVALVDTPETAADLDWILARWPLEMDPTTAARLAARASEHSDTRDEVARILDGYVPPSALREPAITPRDYQTAAAEIVRRTGRLLVADELGLGKTITSLLVLRDPEALPALVVTLTHLPAQWLAELNRALPWLTGHVIKRGQPYEVTADVLIVNYAKLAGWRYHLAGNVRTVIFDEAQELRRGASEKHNAAVAIAEKARFRVGLTATPVYNYGGEIHNVIGVLDRDALGARDEFSREWCVGDYGKLRVKDPAALGSYLRDEGLMVRRTRVEVRRELPEVQRIVHTVDVDDDVLAAEADGAEALARQILAREGTNTDLWRAAGDLDWRLRHATGMAKAKTVAAFTSMLLETGEPVVLFGWHHDVYDTWKHQLAAHSPAFFTGSESIPQKRHATEAFMAGDTNLLIMSLRAGAGLDGLQERAHVCVFGELDWSPGVHEQCISADTEILTRAGWRGRGEIEIGDDVAAFDLATDEIRWEPAVRIVDRPVGAAEHIYELRSASLDLRVTGGHRMVHRHTYGKGHRKTTGWHVEIAERLAARTQWYTVPVAGFESDVPGVPLTDDELRFLGWWITDGNLNPRARQVTICQSSGSPHNEEIVRVLDACGFAWSVNVQSTPTAFGTTPRLIYTIPKRRSHTRAGRGWEPFADYLDKDLSPLLDAMTADQVAVFMEAVHQGDGNKQRGQDWTQRSYHIGIGRRLFADRLQSLLVRRGWRANLSVRPTPAGKPHWTLHTKWGPARSVGGHGKANLTRTPTLPDERVWCVENALSTIVVRRKGKVAIVGNCIGRLHRDGQDEPVVAYYLVADSGSDPVITEVLGVKRRQSDGIIHPDRPLLTEAVENHDRVKLLAAEYLRRNC